MPETEQRRREIASLLAGQKIEALTVTSWANVRYLTGYTGSNGLLLLAASQAIFFTDPRYQIQARQEVDLPVKVARGPLASAAATVIKRKRIKKIGFEKEHLTYADYERLKADLPLGASLKPVGGLIEEQRMVKSASEVDSIRRSVMANSEAFAQTIDRVRAGLRESDIAAELEFRMRRLGVERPAFETIVASGPRSALPHARPTTERILNNELLLIDMGASLGGYTSDMTRMAFVGQPDGRARSMYKAVLEAQLAALDMVHEGATAGQVDRAAREVLKKHGLDRAFVHSTGHGLGLEIHEPPRLGKGDKTRLKAGMVITIEPGAYVEGVGGVRIEDTVLVTKSGCEVLTPTPKELVNV